MENTFRYGIFVVSQSTHDRCTSTSILVRRIFNHYVGLLKETHLFCTFSLDRREIFAMLCTNISDNTYSRLNNTLQTFHFTQFRDTCLKNSQLSILVHLPHRQWYSNLRVIRLGGTCDSVIVFEKGIKPLFNHRLTIGTRDTNHRTMIKRTLISRQIL